MPQVGFVVIAHSNPRQIDRLIRCLNAVYGNPPIALHFDFEQCPAELKVPSNVAVVRPSIRTAWGEFSLVRATLAGMKLLCSGSGAPQWCSLLSGACYPAMPAQRAIDDLERGGYDAYIHHERIDPLNPRRRFHRESFLRYFGWRLKLWNSSYRNVAPPRLNALRSPYARHGFDCYAGAHWFTCRAEAARYLLEWSEANPWLADHLGNRDLPEETYFQTVLCNRPAFRLCGDYRRYIDWSMGGRHPKTLGVEDLPAVFASGAHFARKFPPGSAALDRLDDYLNVSMSA